MCVSGLIDNVIIGTNKKKANRASNKFKSIVSAKDFGCSRILCGTFCNEQSNNAKDLGAIM